MTKNSLGFANWFILILASSAIIFATFLLRGILSTPTLPKEEVTNECGVCGPQGIHNIEGKTCPEGLVCKEGLTTSASYCVRPEESAAKCEEVTKENLTADWKRYRVFDSASDEPTAIEYMLPPSMNPPAWVNAGRYYQETNLPSNTRFGIFLIGKNQGLQYSYESLLIEVITKNQLTTKTSTINQLTAIEFSGNIPNYIFSSNLLILGEGVDEFRGLIAKIDNNLSLYLLHYQDKLQPVSARDFVSDEKVFDQILSIFKFTE